MRRILHLSVISRMDRHLATDAVRAAISDCGGWIVDFKLYSNAMTTIRFELPAGRVRDLAAALAAASLPPDAESRTRLAGWPATGEGETAGTLQLTHVHDEADLRREVPAFNV